MKDDLPELNAESAFSGRVCCGMEHNSRAIPSCMIDCTIGDKSHIRLENASALSKGPNSVGVFLYSPVDGKWSSWANVFCSF
jgi:hypothetical protein